MLCEHYKSDVKTLTVFLNMKSSSANDENNCLMLAVKHEQTAIVKYLKSDEIDHKRVLKTDNENSKGENVMEIAIVSKNCEIVQLLYDSQVHNGQIASDIASLIINSGAKSYEKYKEFCKNLLSQSEGLNGSEIIKAAIKQKQIELVKYMWNNKNRFKEGITVEFVWNTLGSHPSMGIMQFMLDYGGIAEDMYIGGEYWDEYVYVFNDGT